MTPTLKKSEIRNCWKCGSATLPLNAGLCQSCTEIEAAEIKERRLNEDIRDAKFWRKYKHKKKRKNVKE